MVRESLGSRGRAEGNGRISIRCVSGLALLCGLLFVSLAPQAAAASTGDDRSQTGREMQGRIVNGTVAPEGSWPSIALIDANGSQCGGTLIDRYSVLSAAHCFVGNGAAPENTFVYMGSNDILAGSELKVWGIFPHPGYNPDTEENDIALLVLDEPTSLPAMPFTRPGSDALLTPGNTGHIAGWGTTCFETCDGSSVLLEATVPIRSWDECSALFDPEGLVFTEGMFCAGGGIGTSDTCQGDSGGPIAVDGPAGRTLVGVVSWGVGCADPVFPGVYTNVSRYGSWIGGLTLDRVSSPKRLRVRGRSTIRVRNLSSLQLPGSISARIKGRFRVARNTCRNVPFNGSCSVTVRDRSRRITRGTLDLWSQSGLRVARVALRG